MKTYRCKLEIEYEFEAESEEDAIYALADLIRHDWSYYIDEAEIEEVKDGKVSSLDRGH